MKVSGNTGLSTLLRDMSPRLATGEYVFCAFPAGKVPGALSPLCTFQEKEGMSVICRRRDADRLGLPRSQPHRLITLAVHSSLAAVGFLAAVSTELARAGIACNAVSAFHHDHLLVPSRDARRALALLRALSKRHRCPSTP
jgi:hypothetical protein